MEDFAQRIKNITTATRRLIDNSRVLQGEIDSLKAENKALMSELTQTRNEVGELQEKLKVLKLAKSISGDEERTENTELKRKINEYIKEVDKCIALLNE